MAFTLLLFSRCLHSLGLSLARSLNPNFYHVKVGGLTLSLLEPHSTLVAVRNVFVHPIYLWEDTSSGDIALIQLDTLLQPSQFTPVCLPEANAALTPATVCWVTGWGSTQERGKGYVHTQTLPLSRGCTTKLWASPWPGVYWRWIWGTPPGVQDSAYCRSG